MSTGRIRHGVAALGSSSSSSCLVVAGGLEICPGQGGRPARLQSLSSVEVVRPPLPHTWNGKQASTLSSTVLSSSSSSSSPLRPSSWSWNLPPLSEPRSSCCMVIWGNRLVVVGGVCGRTSRPCVVSVETMRFADTGSWETLERARQQARRAMTTTTSSSLTVDPTNWDNHHDTKTDRDGCWWNRVEALWCTHIYQHMLQHPDLVQSPWFRSQVV